MRWIAFAAPLLMTAPLLAQDIVLDDFDSLINDEAGGPREVSSVVNANPFGQPSSFDVFDAFSYEGINGAAIFNSGIGVEQVGTIVWDNDGAGLNFDAAALGVVGFELDFLQIDQAFSVNMYLTTFGGGIADSATAAGRLGPATELTTFSISSFLVDWRPESGFDFSDVDRITITFNTSLFPASTASLDFILTEFRATVPTPGAAALLGLGGLLAMRRRR